MILGEYKRMSSEKNDAASLRFFPTFAVFLMLCVAGRAVEAQETAQSGYSLVGTIQSGDLTGAVITVSKTEQTFFRKFEKLPDGSQIVEVHPDSIALKRDDGTKFEMYTLHETKTIASAQPAAPPANTRQPEVRQSIPEPYYGAPPERIPNSHGKRRRTRSSPNEE